MQKQILFIQGGGPGTHDNWDNKLVESLRRELGPGYEILYPRMPNEDDPSYSLWKAALANEIEDLDEGAVLIGHSIGGTILINFLAEARPNLKFDGICLIAAPFVGAGGWPGDEIDMTANLGEKLSPQTPIYIYHGTEDDTAPLAHMDLYQKVIPGAIMRRLIGRDHQLNNNLAEVAEDILTLS